MTIAENTLQIPIPARSSTTSGRPVSQGRYVPALQQSGPIPSPTLLTTASAGHRENSKFAVTKACSVDDVISKLESSRDGIACHVPQQNLSSQLFELVARTPRGRQLAKAKACSDRRKGSVSFGDFAKLHQILLKKLQSKQLGNASAAGVTKDLANESSPRRLEKEFRRLDVDHSLALDMDEWENYTGKLVQAFGIDEFNCACQDLALQDQNGQDNYDARFSQRLLDKVVAANHLSEKHTQLAVDLLQRRADPNVGDSGGTNILAHAAGKCDVSFAACLLQFRAEPSEKTSTCDSAILAAARASKLDVLAILLGSPGSAPDDKTKLSNEMVDGIANSSVEESKKLIMQGADINFKNDKGWTPLTSAVFWARHDCLECMLRLSQSMPSARLDLEARNAKGQTALSLAARKGDLKSANSLIAAKANLDARDVSMGWTPMHHAVFNSHSDIVLALYNASADVQARDEIGITPNMLRAGATLSEKATRAIMPPEHVDWSKKILPILKDESLLPNHKLEKLFDLVRGSGGFDGLHLYDQLFDSRRGPNGTRLNQLYNNLCREMISRLRSGVVDASPTQSSEDERVQRQAQLRFVETWLRGTRGPLPSADWHWDNRDSYRSDLTSVVKAEVEAFSEKGRALLGAIRAEPDGEELLSLPRDEILRYDCLTQHGAHPILTWLDSADAAGAFHALRDVGALGLRTERERSAMLKLVELVTQDSDFSHSPGFWQNVYKLWLSSYVQVADQSFQQQMSSFAERWLNDDVKYTRLPPKTYAEMLADEGKLGQPGWRSFSERTIAAGMLDIVRCEMHVGSPSAALKLVAAFRSAGGGKRSTIELVRVRNGFHESCDPLGGYRELVLNVLVDCGEQWKQSGAHLPLRLICEVRVILATFQPFGERLNPLLRYLRGDFDLQSPKIV
jgi:ankyrin repeat protein